MKALVTGAGGMVGSHLVEMLYNNGFEVMGTWHKNRVNIDQVISPIKFIQCDLRYGQQIDELIMDYLPDQIYHLAAQSYPTLSWVNPMETVDVNIKGTIAVFEAVKKARKYRNGSYDPVIVVACSSAEYGESLNKANGELIRVKEYEELLPLHPYGVSKVAQDLLAFQYYKNDKINCVRARIFNSTGTRKVNDVTADFTKRAVLCERTGNYKFRVGNINTKRAILDQRDLVEALILLANNGKYGEAYNISSERIYPIREIISIIENEIDHRLEVYTDPELIRPTDEPIIVGDVSKIRADTGWKQKIFLEETVADMLNYWRRIL